MGTYEREQQLITEGKAQRGQAALDYFTELDAASSEEQTTSKRRPDYEKTLFAPEHDDIYREFCAYLDLPKPRYFDAVENPISIEGYTATDIYIAMKKGNPRIVDIDAAAVYNMLVKLRVQPDMAHRVLGFKATCYQPGCAGGGCSV